MLEGEILKGAIVTPQIQLSILVLRLLPFPEMRYNISFVVGFCFRFAFCPCHAFHIMSSCASHLHTCSSHVSEHFPRCPFCNPSLLRPPAPSFVSFRERVLNILEMDRDFPSGLGIPLVDRLSSFVPFGVCLILQRLTGEP